MIIKEANFKCLRCGHQWEGPFDKQVLRERTCSKCGSNSVRKLKAPPRKGGGDHQPGRTPADA